ncbi:FAD-dependent oxidoreductase [Lipingzhangella sp. LS1_29]|uniref:FAD-dependent oxidoreductase n=1 Tax=Lipingzhangella rawalii TaxID=2055835 RepID=A0ABU2H5N8_9ACTN|nr:FAD-dependent oxidoreductase [Lipingzhangella rawalii]MDS1270610.1 FAD-dependent oxidoreductase [Lipingzhangella rawalii]
MTATAEYTVDTVVVGLGAMGAQTLWRLAQRGVDVLGIDAFDPGHAHGSSHGESRIIRTAYLEGTAYVPLAQAAWKGWDELGRESETQVARRCGSVMIGPPDSRVVSGAAESARQHELAHRRYTPAQLSAEFPGHVVVKNEEGLYEGDGGVVFPETAIRAAVRLAQYNGARVWTGTRVRGIIPDASQPRVWVTDREGSAAGTGDRAPTDGAAREQTIRARCVVVTAGAWLPQLLPDLARRLGGLGVERRVLAWFPVTEPDWHDPEHTPVFVRAESDGTAWYGFPSLDGGRTVKIGVHADGASGPGVQRGERVDPDIGPRPADAADAQRLARLAERLRGIDPTPSRLTTCMYTMTQDQHFLIGPHPRVPGLLLGGGFSGHGYKFASAVGRALADLAQQGTTTVPIHPFRPDRLG